MTIKEALANKIPCVRLPQWNARAYLELPILEGGYGPWATLHDPMVTPRTARVMAVSMFSLLDDPDDRYEVYV